MRYARRRSSFHALRLLPGDEFFEKAGRMTTIKFKKGRFAISEEKVDGEQRFTLRHGSKVVAVLTPKELADLFNVVRRMNLYLAIDDVAPDLPSTSEKLD
jgi:hypothetical protein